MKSKPNCGVTTTDENSFEYYFQRTEQKARLRHVQTCAILLIFFMLTELNLDAFLFHVFYYNCGVWVVIFFYYFFLVSNGDHARKTQEPSKA